MKYALLSRRPHPLNAVRKSVSEYSTVWMHSTYLQKTKNLSAKLLDAFKFRQNKQEGVTENSAQSVTEYLVKIKNIL